MNPRKRGAENLELFKKAFLDPDQTLKHFQDDWVEFVRQLEPEPGAPDFRKMKSMF